LEGLSGVVLIAETVLPVIEAGQVFSKPAAQFRDQTAWLQRDAVFSYSPMNE